MLQNSLVIADYIKEEAIKLYMNDIKKDWQLQGSLILFLVLIFLFLLVKFEWNAYGPAIMEMELGKIPPYAANDNIDGSFESYPDEDPLTFLKKNR